MKVTTTEGHDVSTLYRAAALELKDFDAKAEVGNISGGAQVKFFGAGGG